MLTGARLCRDEDCPMRQLCIRYTATAIESPPSYIKDIPGVVATPGARTCQFFIWDTAAATKLHIPSVGPHKYALYPRDRAPLETIADDLEEIARAQADWANNPAARKLMSISRDIKQVARRGTASEGV